MAFNNHLEFWFNKFTKAMERFKYKHSQVDHFLLKGGL